MTTDAVPIETAHKDMIICIRFRPHTHGILIPFKHDAQLDYYGKWLATCSSDRTVKVFNLVDGEPFKSGGQTLKGCVQHTSLRLLLTSTLPVTLDPSGKSCGPIPSSVISLHHARTTVKCSSGESKHKGPQLDRGWKSRSTCCTPRQVLPLLVCICFIWPSGVVQSTLFFRPPTN